MYLNFICVNIYFIFTFIGWFGYKLYRSLMEKNRRKEEKKKAKHQRKDAKKK